MVDPTSCAALLSTFVNAAAAASNSGVAAGKSDTLVRIVLTAMPWVGKLLADEEGTTESLGAMINKIETYTKSRGTDHRSMVAVFASTATTTASLSLAEYLEAEEPTPKDSLDLLWLQVSDLIQRDWKEVMLFRSV